jgi:hypothetical protein
MVTEEKDEVGKHREDEEEEKEEEEEKQGEEEEEDDDNDEMNVDGKGEKKRHKLLANEMEFSRRITVESLPIQTDT